ncbi:MAG: EutN/CcmL family microcompartment protein [Polyangia bacterium]
MFLAKVIGTVWSTVKWPELGGLRLLVVRPYSLADLKVALPEGVSPAPAHEGVVCADVLGAGPGEDVVIAYGHAARVAISELLAPGEQPSVPIDAAVVAIVDHFAVSSG